MITRARRFTTVEMQFRNEEVARRWILKLNTEKWKLFPMYFGRRIVRNIVGGIYHDIRAEWFVAALVKYIQADFKIMSLNITEVVNWWGYGMELYSHSTSKIIRICLRLSYATSKT